MRVFAAQKPRGVEGGVRVLQRNNLGKAEAKMETETGVFAASQERYSCEVNLFAPEAIEDVCHKKNHMLPLIMRTT